VQNENFARLEGVLAGSFLGLQKTLSDLMTPISRLGPNPHKRPCVESEVTSDSQGTSAKAAKAIATGFHRSPSAIAIGNSIRHANRTNVHTISKSKSVHTATRPDDPAEPELDYNDYSGEDCSEDEADAAHNPNSDSVSIPEQDTLDADVQALLHDHEQVGDNQLLLDQIQEDLLNDADTGDPVNGKLADIISGLWGQKLTPEKLKVRLNKFLRPKNCDIFVPKCNKDIWSDKIDTMARQFDLMMQKVQNMILHCTYGIVAISDKALKSKSHDSSEIAGMSIDLAAILMNAMHEMNQIRRESMKPKLGNLAKLANEVPPNAPLLFGSEEDMNKRITKIMATNSAMAKSIRGEWPKNFKTPPYYSRYGMRGQRGGRSRGRSYRRPPKKQNYNGHN